MSPGVSVAPATRTAVLAFEAGGRLVVRQVDGKWDLPFTGPELTTVTARLDDTFADHTPPAGRFTAEIDRVTWQVYLVQIRDSLATSDLGLQSIDALEQEPERLAPPLAGVLAQLDPHLATVPYLHLGENDFIYRFRPNQERNPSAYTGDHPDGALYQSRLCAAIKDLARRNERSATAPIALDFGAIQYLVPSHFGFCLGVKNAIERAYETLAENPGRRVFMLSELIHNPFVNEDLYRRGLRYLQTDRGIPFTVTGHPARAGGKEALLWDTLTAEDIVIIPAFGATDEDKRRLVRRGVGIFPHDATCMLVEKVWKAARAYGRAGFTVVIHGKHEHEETKATFSNTRRFAPAVIVRDLAEARQLGEIIASDDPACRARFHEIFAGRHTPGFDVARDLERIAVVNQTTLLMNETLAIIGLLQEVYRAKYSDDSRVGGGGRRDTLCYATQVNQDALARALATPLDAAFVVGGRNSSNTHQLFRLCEAKLGARAFFIQSEAAIRAPEAVEHFVYGGGGEKGRLETRPLWPGGAGTTVRRVLVTGGASCPDGIIQQVMVRLNSFYPRDRLRSIDQVLADLGEGQHD